MRTWQYIVLALALSGCEYVVRDTAVVPEETDRLYTYERYCDDERDNDGDGLVDCDDIDDCLERCTEDTDMDTDTDI